MESVRYVDGGCAESSACGFPKACGWASPHADFRFRVVRVAPLSLLSLAQYIDHIARHCATRSKYSKYSFTLHSAALFMEPVKF